MKKLVMKESGRNWIRKGPSIFIIIVFSLFGALSFGLAVSDLIMSKSGTFGHPAFESENRGMMMIFGALLLVIPWLIALRKRSEIEVISDGDQLVINKDNDEEFRVRWSDIVSVNGIFMFNAVKSYAFSYMDNGKKKTYGLNALYLKNDDVLEIARLIDECWTGKFGKAKITDLS